MNDGGYEVE